MYNAKYKALPILALPILLTISFFIFTAALAEGASVDVEEWQLQTTSRVASTGSHLGFEVPEATSDVTGTLTITGVKEEVGATFATISWDTSEPTDTYGEVRYGTSDSLGFSVTESVTGTETHSVGLANLTPGTNYFYEVAYEVAHGEVVYNDTFTTSAVELKHKAFVGTVMGEPAGTVTLMLNGDQGEVTIELPGDYILKRPGGDRAGTFQNGARVVILCQSTGDGWVALQVLVKPIMPALPLVGVVTGVGPTSLTVLDHKGVPHFLRLNGEEGSPEEGEVVTVFRGNSGQAKGLVRAQEVQERMQNFLENETSGEDGEGEATDVEAHGKHAEALIKALERIGSNRINLLDAALDRVPDHVKERIEAGKTRAQRGIDASQAAIGKAKGKFHLAGSSDEEGDGGVEGETEDPSSGETVFPGSKGKSDHGATASGERGSGKSGDRGGRPDGKGKPNN